MLLEHHNNTDDSMASFLYDLNYIQSIIHLVFFQIFHFSLLRLLRLTKSSIQRDGINLRYLYDIKVKKDSQDGGDDFAPPVRHDA